MIFKITTIGLIAVGTFFLISSSLNTKKIFNVLKGKMSYPLWRKLFYFMLFFSICYICVILMILFDMLSYLVVMTGTVFAFGAVFVFLVTKLGHSSIHDLEQEVKERTLDLEISHEELEKSHEKNHAILQALPDIMFVLDHDGKCHEIKFTETDREIEKMKPVFFEKNIYDIEVKDEIENAYLTSQRIVHTHYLNKEECLQGDKVIHCDYQLQYKNKLFDFEARCVAMEKEKIVCVVRDITELKALQRKMAAKKNEALREAKLKSQFLANMSHEIRTPLNAVIGIADLMLQEDITEKQADYLKIMQESGNTLLYLVNDILDFSKVQTGEIALEKIPFRLDSTVENVTHTIETLAKQKNIEIIHQLPRELDHFLIGDPHRLKQVLTNLANNALKFTSQGDIKLIVELCYENLKTNTIKLRFGVKDHGIGVPKEKQKQIFEEFTQSDMSTTRKYGGTGLGLAISKKLVELMGGKIHITSPVYPDDEFPGSEFWFELTFPKGNTYNQNLEQRSRSSETPLIDKKICFFSDNHDIFHDIQYYLQDMGVNIYTQENNISFGSVTPDLIIVDTRFHLNGGFETAAELKKNNPKIPLLIYAAIGMSGDAKKCYEMNIDGYLAAPTDKDTFVKIIKKLLFSDISREKKLITQYSITEDITSHNVLVAEDNEVNQMLIKRMLDKNHCQVDIAENGKRAVELAKNKKYDIIFMDVNMPVMDGYEAASHIRNSDPEIRIIAVTAHALPEFRERCFQSGMNQIILKPFKFENITEVIENISKQCQYEV